jgi:Ca2+-binding EF-hand superfamily protein
MFVDAEIVYLFKKMDWDHDGRVSSKDFARFVVSQAFKSAINAR